MIDTPPSLNADSVVNTKAALLVTSRPHSFPNRPLVLPEEHDGLSERG